MLIKLFIVFFAACFLQTFSFGIEKKVQVRTNTSLQSYDVSYESGVYSIELSDKTVEFIDFSEINSIIKDDLKKRYIFSDTNRNVQNIYALEQEDRNTSTYSVREKERRSSIISNKLEWCRANKSCDSKIEDYQEKLKNLKEEIVTSRKVGSCVDLNDEDTISEILHQNKNSALNYRVSYEEYLKLDESYCNAVSGILATHLELAGLEEGKDYNFSAGPSHVFIELPKQDKIIDPTMAQFFKKGSSAHSYLLMQGGFVGSRHELGKYLYANRESFIYKGKLGKELKASLKTSNPEESFVGILEKIYYGRKTTSENGLIKVAQEMRDKNLRELTNQHKLKYNENYSKMADFISEQNHSLECSGPILKPESINHCEGWVARDKKTDSFLGDFLAVFGFDPVKKVKN